MKNLLNKFIDNIVLLGQILALYVLFLKKVFTNIVVPTSFWSEASEKSKYLIDFCHMFVYVIFQSKRTS